MAWWEKLFEPMPTGNLVGDTLSAINGSPAAAERSESGSFDPNKIKMAMPEAYREGVAPYVDTLTGLANQRQAAIEQAYQMPKSTWMQGLGRALSAISVPVGYAQGSSYGPAMLGRTEQDLYNRRSDAYQDRLNAVRAQGVDQLYSGLGQSAVDYISKTNERTREAKLQAARIMAAARRTGDPRAIAEAEALAKQLMEAQGVSTTTGGSAAPRSAVGAPAAVASPGGAVSTGVPGTTMTPPTGVGPDVEIGVPTMAAPPPPAAGSAEDLARYKRAQAAYLMEVDPKAAEALIKEADKLEEPGQKGKIKYSEENAKNAAALAEQARAAAQNAPAIVASLDRLMGVATQENFPESTVGTIDSAKFPFSDRTVGDIRMALTPGVNEAGHVDTRQALKNELKFLALRMKDFVRKPGEGTWTDYDQENLENLASGGAEASYDQAGLIKTLTSLRERIQTTIMDPVGVKLPPGRTSVDPGTGAPRTSADAPNATPGSGQGGGQYRIGQTARNPETGERVYWNGRAFVPFPDAQPTPDWIAP